VHILYDGKNVFFISIFANIKNILPLRTFLSQNGGRSSVG
jgi:hypothetical protein